MATRGRPSKKENQLPSYFSKLNEEPSSDQSKLSMVLGGLIILVVGILVFNYFNKNKDNLGPAQQTEQTDVSPENLPGKYTVKENDTLFTIAEKYYKDGYKYTEIAKTNNLTDVNAIEAGQVLEIPKLSEQEAMASPSESPESAEATEVPAMAPTPGGEVATGGADVTIWGPKIEAESYTVVEGDWLSTISARAYGDVYAYKKLAEANNIANPDLIYPGQVIKIPR